MLNTQYNSTNSGEIVVRDNKGRFLGGHQKLGGRIKGGLNFSTKVKDALVKVAGGNSISYEEALVRKILNKAIVEGDVRIIKLIWSYLDGAPTKYKPQRDSESYPSLTDEQKSKLDLMLENGINK